MKSVKKRIEKVLAEICGAEFPHAVVHVAPKADHRYETRAVVLSRDVAIEEFPGGGYVVQTYVFDFDADSGEIVRGSMQDGSEFNIYDDKLPREVSRFLAAHLSPSDEEPVGHSALPPAVYLAQMKDRYLRSLLTRRTGEKE